MARPAAGAIMSAEDSMAEPIVIVAETSEEADDLALLLARHGLPARPHDEEVEVVSPREDTGLLLADLAVTLRWWLDDRALESIVVRIGTRALVYERSGRYVADAKDHLVRAGA